VRVLVVGWEGKGYVLKCYNQIIIIRIFHPDSMYIHCSTFMLTLVIGSLAVFPHPLFYSIIRHY